MKTYSVPTTKIMRLSTKLAILALSSLNGEKGATEVYDVRSLF